MSALALQSFGFGDQLVRAQEREGAIWFVANDVCGALEISNPRDAVKKLDDDERDDVGITDAIGRKQSTTIISESGVYSLIFKSRKPQAVAFRRWVTGEVLPALRMHGRFETDVPPDILPEHDGMDFIERVRAGLQMVREARVTFGNKAAQRAWTLAGLPDVSSPAAKVTGPILDAREQSVAKWFEDRVELVAGERESATKAYIDYARWCDEGGERPVTISKFGRDMTHMGLEKAKHGSIYYLGIRLKP